MPHDPIAPQPAVPQERGRGDAGAAAVEYALLIALVALGIVSAVTGLAGQIIATFAQVGTHL